jgi:glucan phosphoethanolaminetransferase (alkaline phosphatase superfamily)
MKASSALPLGMGLASLLEPRGSRQALGEGRQNVLIVVFDAWSAYHLALHGYPRETMPNLNRHLDRAIVYHRHYAPADFTTPGTALAFAASKRTSFPPGTGQRATAAKSIPGTRTSRP